METTAPLERAGPLCFQPEPEPIRFYGYHVSRSSVAPEALAGSRNAPPKPTPIPIPMHAYVVRAVRTVAVVALVVSAACGDSEVGSSKLKSLKVGDSREAVIELIGTGPLTASGADTSRLEHGFRRMTYFANGRQFEVIYFREAAGAVTDPVEQALETPVVLADNKVLGTGWKYYVSAMKEFNLPTPLVEKLPAKAVDSSNVVTMDTAAKPAMAPKASAMPESLQKKM